MSDTGTTPPARRSGPARSLVHLARRITWRLVHPYVAELITEQAVLKEKQRRLETELATVRKDLLATNHRITWIEDGAPASLDEAVE